MNKLLAQLVPFLLLGVILVILVLGILFISYILIIGAVVGLILFTLQWIRAKLFPPKHLTKSQDQSRPGRTFDHRE